MKETPRNDEQSTTTATIITKMTRNHLARSASQQQQQLQQQLIQTSPHHHHQQQQQLTQSQQQQQQQQQHQQNKWTTKERLFLVSCVLINGEANWTFISDQLNKWMKYTTNCLNVPFSSSLSLLGSNSTNQPTINIRTNNVKN